MKKQKKGLNFANIVVDKKQLKYLIVWAFRHYGIARAANMADKLKDLGFYYATKAGISLSLEDLRIPPSKKELLEQTINLIIKTDYKYTRGEITIVERFQKVIDTWNNSSEMLKKEVIKYFKTTDPLNAIYMMAFSGARGNISQVRQLVGMRGLMSDPQGQIIDLPISSNFREGLTVTDYFISSYGARKGLVDTALRTADSGYLTRRLVDVAQDVIIRETDCKTLRGILIENVFDHQKKTQSLEQALIGRLLAEDVFHPKTKKLVAKANQDIDDVLAQDIIKAGVSTVLIRSPITCNAQSSVCQKCYGWNLAHGKLVDLGEAVGIIAAQSIGEPGTQLTMRTFHTGGVFTGEFTDKVLAPFDCIVEYDPSFLQITRTRHGEQAYSVQKDFNVFLKATKSQTSSKILINRNAILLVKNGDKVLYNNLIAEYPLKNLLTTEKAQKSVVSDISGKICFTDLTIEEVENKHNIIRSAQKGGLIWVLSGSVQNITDDAEIVVHSGQMIYPGSMLAVTKVISKHSGYLRILPQKSQQSHQEILIITASQTLLNTQIILDKYQMSNNYLLQMYNRDKFVLKISPCQKIINGQVIAELISDVYRTNTGGIIKYLDLPVSINKLDINHEYYNILGAGYVLWIAEETHEVNKDISLLLVKHGDFIESGTEIIKNLFSQNAGIVEILEKDNIVREIIIKPCKIYDIPSNSIDINSKKRGFLRPGEKIINSIVTDRLVYWEYFDSLKSTQLLIRPVVVYSVPKKSYTFTYTNDSFRAEVVKLKLVRRIDFKDGTRIKSVNGLDLIKTYLTIELMDEFSELNCFSEFVYLNNTHLSLKFIVADSILIKDNQLNTINKEVISDTRLLMKNNDFADKNQVIAQTELFSTITGQVFDVENSKYYNRRFLILTDLDKQVYNIGTSNNCKVQLHDWISKGQEIASGVKSSESGKIISIEDNKLILRIGRPYLISNGSILHVDHNDLIQRGENLATLIFDRVKTGDIVQGLPRIEEILEARKKNDGPFNPHAFLEQRFRFHLSIGLSLYDATKMSFQEVQLLLIKEVQLVYQSQGVDISDKHIEVIVKQMTSKVKIEKGGDTNHLPGEIVALQKIEEINEFLTITNKSTALYHPILLGITKASLNTESFISAASFQETTKVLTEAAISGKLDWLKGLKENVIIGRLIPAGTGFDIYNQTISDYGINYSSQKNSYKNIESVNSIDNFDDIVFDDRIVK